ARLGKVHGCQRRIKLADEQEAEGSFTDSRSMAIHLRRETKSGCNPEATGEIWAKPVGTGKVILSSKAGDVIYRSSGITNAKPKKVDPSLYQKNHWSNQLFYWFLRKQPQKSICMHSVNRILPSSTAPRKETYLHHPRPQMIYRSRTKQILFQNYGSESVILNRNESNSDSADSSRIRFRTIVLFGRNRIQSFPLRIRILNFVPE
ncbi:hypothetical protein AVEN_196566-1, partial [Araneus ventricosus]